MANRSYKDFNMDELDGLGGDYEPYDSISSRRPLQSFVPTDPLSQDSGSSSAPNPMIKEMIKNRSSAVLNNPLVDKGDSSIDVAGQASKDPLMKQFDESQDKLDQYRKAKTDSDFISNMGLALGRFAQGSNAPTSNTQLYENMQKQNQGELAGREEDVGRRTKVMEAIEARKSREGIDAANRATRELMAKQHGQDLAARMSDRESAKTDAQVNKWTTQMKDDLDPNKARGGNLAQNQKRVDNAERIETLLAQVHNNPDPRQMEELAISAQALLSASGTPAAEQVKALIPKTAMGSVNAFKEWLTNDPTGTGQQEFVKRMADTVEREKGVALGQVQKAQRQRLSAYGKFKQADPDSYNAILNSYGLGDEAKPGISAQQEAQMGAAVPVRMQAPDGTIRLVPADKVDAALKSGGKRL